MIKNLLEYLANTGVEADIASEFNLFVKRTSEDRRNQILNLLQEIDDDKKNIAVKYVIRGIMPDEKFMDYITYNPVFRQFVSLCMQLHGDELQVLGQSIQKAVDRLNIKLSKM